MAGNRLSDHAEIVMGQSPPGERCNTRGDGVPLLNGPTEFGPHHPTPVQFTTDARKTARPGDVLFCVRGSTTGRMNWADRAYAVGRGIAAIRHKADSRLQPLVRAVIEYNLPRLLAQATGSTFPNVSGAQLGDLCWPSLEKNEQRAIADILGTLDDKIELNRQMNETLEAMAWALFKSWFVDFDPVRAKVAGRDPGLPLHLADLFPDSLQDSELGDIPEGWHVGPIYETADVIYGAPFSSSLFNSDGRGEPLVRIRDLPTESPAVWTEEVHPKGYRLQPGDVVVGMDGEFRAYLWGGVPAWLNQRVSVFIPKPNSSAAFVRSSIVRPLAEVEATEAATTVIHLGKYDIDRFRIVHATPEVLRAFNAWAQPWYDRIVVAKAESRMLASLRDALLPQLVSGNLQVPDPESIVGRAV